MEGRGRKSTAALSVVRASPVEAYQRPQPPADLTDEQADEWVAIINRLPADWINRETEPLLAQYCRHIAASRRVAALVQQAEADKDCDLRDYDRLLKMQEREGRAMTSLATKMRISQQATYDKSKKKPTQLRQLWEG